MQLPAESSQYTALVRWGRYLSRRLRTARLASLASECDAITNRLRDDGRASEDAEGPVQEATADRDAADDGLSDVAQESRHALAARSLDAVRKAPYTQVFPDGVAYYLDASFEAKVARFGELRARFEAHLPEGDELRAQVTPRIQAAVKAYKTADAALATARTHESIISTRVDATTTEWRLGMERIYGALIQQSGKVAAERYFPHARSAKGASRKKSPAKPVVPVA